MIRELNPQQEKAATTLTGHVLIEAGAGSGKTRTLTERFVNAVLPGAVAGWKPASIDELLAITFTDKAAGELSERIRGALRRVGCAREAREIDGAWISTIHGLCARLLRRHAIEAGLDPMFRVLEESEAARFAERAFDETAARAVKTPEGNRLFAAYDYDELYGAATDVWRSARTSGIDSPRILVPVGARDATALLREACSLFGSISTQLNERTGVAACIAKNQQICHRLACALSGIESGLDEHTLAETLWRALEAHPPARSAKAIADLWDVMKTGRDRLLAEAATIVAQPYAESLVSLVQEYGLSYANAKSNSGVVDFDDLQAHTAALLEAHPTLAARYASQFRLVMVDEFQDTDELQTRILRALARDDLCTVGDERQSIYRFRGADVNVFRNHRRFLAGCGAEPLPLDLNYRSHPDVLAFVNGLFSGDEMFAGDFIRLQAGREEPAVSLLPRGTPRIQILLAGQRGNHSSDTVQARHAETAAVGDAFRALHHEHGVAPGSMAILLRTYRYADEFAAALRSRGMPAVVVGGSRFFDAAETEMLRALCRLLANPADDEAFIVAAISELSVLDDDALVRLAAIRASRGGSLWEALRVAAREDGRAGGPFALFEALVEQSRARVGAMPISEVLLRAVEESETDLVLLAEGGGASQRFANVLKFARMADAFEAAGGAGPGAFASYLDTKERSGAHETPAQLSDTAASAVRIMSIHAAKGLEFPVVAVAQLGASENHSSRGIARILRQADAIEVALRLPSSWSARGSEAGRPGRFTDLDEKNKSEDAEEAKRLLYVACTRAEDVLILAGSADLGKSAEHIAGPLGQVLRAIGGGVPDEPGSRDTRVAFDGVSVSVGVGGATEAGAKASGEQRNARGGRVAVARPWEPEQGQPALTRGHAERLSRLSYSDVAKYERCPLRYWAECVARVGIANANEPDDPLRFGQAAHSALQAVGPAGERLDGDVLTRVGRFHALDDRGMARLVKVVESQIASPVAAAIVAHEHVVAEFPFAVSVGQTPDDFVLVGAMDVYARTRNQGLIVDYKTGVCSDGYPNPAYVRQARFYALVALRDGCECVQVVFSYPEDLDHAGLPKTTECVFSQANANEIEAELADIQARMSSGRVAPLSRRDPVTCLGCPIASGVCPAPGGRR